MKMSSIVVACPRCPWIPKYTTCKSKDSIIKEVSNVKGEACKVNMQEIRASMTVQFGYFGARGAYIQNP